MSPPVKGARVGLISSAVDEGHVLSPQAAWICTNCTFENSASIAKCDICHTARPGGAVREAVPAVDRMTRLYRLICHPEGYLPCIVGWMFHSVTRPFPSLRTGRVSLLSIQ